MGRVAQVLVARKAVMAGWAAVMAAVIKVEVVPQLVVDETKR